MYDSLKSGPNKLKSTDPTGQCKSIAREPCGECRSEMVKRRIFWRFLMVSGWPVLAGIFKTSEFGQLRSQFRHPNIWVKFYISVHSIFTCIFIYPILLCFLSIYIYLLICSIYFMFICVYCVCFVARSDGEQHGFPIFRTGDFGSFVLNWSCIAALCALGGKETPLKPANEKKMYIVCERRMQGHNVRKLLKRLVKIYNAPQLWDT